MSAIDDYVRHHYLIIDGEDFTSIDSCYQYAYDMMNSKLKAYAKEQIDAGAKLYVNPRVSNIIKLICQAKTKDGQICYIIQDLCGDPRDDTFVICSAKGEDVCTIDRSKQCSGLDITDTETIMKRALVCGKCGKPVDSFEELNHILFGKAECDECFKITRDDYSNS